MTVLLPAALVRLTAHALSPRLSPYNGISCGQREDDVRVYGGGSNVIDEGEVERKEEGR